MNFQKMFLATVVGFIVMFGLAGLFHLVIMKDYFAEKLGGEPVITYPIFSYAILALLMSYMYPMMVISSNAMKDGLCFGILVGLLCRVPLQVLHLGYGTGDWGYVITEGIWHSVEEGIGGIAIAMMYARGATTN